MPAIARRIEGLPFSAQSIASVETQNPAIHRDWVTRAQLQTHWVQSGAVNALAQAVCALAKGSPGLRTRPPA